MRKTISTALGVLAIVFQSGVYAQQDKITFEQYVSSLKKEAIAQGIESSLVERAFADVTYHPRAVKADRNQPEKRLTLDEYIPRAVPDWKVKQAQKLYAQYRQPLERISKEYGVPARFIVALWGVESNFGRFTGGYQVVDALATMAYEGRREAFFKKELMSALSILQQGHIKLEDFKGSWAGAMGQPQFMPSSFLSFAADGNGDGKKDIWQTPEDVFASAANYLKQAGWDDTYTWGRQVHLPADFDLGLQGREAGKEKTLQQWQALGVRRFDGRDLPKLSTPLNAWLIAPDDANGRVYLVYNNYNVLMKWNRSYYFALAVSHLADRLVMP